MSLRRWASVAAAVFHEREAPAGDRFATARGHGMEYAESRQYSPGDDVRRMDWPVTARTGKPHTKLFHVERGHEYMVVVDLRSAMRFGTRAAFKQVVAAHIAALAGWAAAHNHGRFGAVIVSNSIQCFPPGTAARTVPEICGALEQAASSTYASGEDMPISDAMSLGLARASNGSTFVVLSDFHDEPEQLRASFSALAARGSLTTIWIADPFELELPANGTYSFSTGSTSTSIDCAQPWVSRQHQAFITARQALLTDAALMYGARTRRVCCGENVFGALAARHAITAMPEAPTAAGNSG